MGLAVALCLALPLPGADPSPPNLVLLFADDLGYGDEAVREGKWKLRIAPREDDALWDRGPAAELFDLDQDPSESYNQAASHPEIVARLKALREKASIGIKPGRALDSVRRF